jgi:transposase-like protein
MRDKRRMERAVITTGEGLHVPLCPSCRRPMLFKRAIPRVGGLPELRTYECTACGVSYTEAVEAGADADLET